MVLELFRIKYDLNKIDEAVAGFWEKARDYRVIAFSGGLGAGKTTFIHALCEKLGVADNVSSPTFALINEYHFTDSGSDRVIYHMDWYRLNSTEEAINAGMEDCLQQSEALCLVEWPEKAQELLRPPYLHVSIENAGDNERMLCADLYK